MPFCLALFFVRTVFIGYKYLFFLLLVPCVVYSMYMFVKHKVRLPNLWALWLPTLVIVLFLLHFILVSNVTKESINIILILYFIAFSKLYYADDKCDAFLKWIVRLTMLAGCIAIARFALSLVGIAFPLNGALCEGKGFSLVRDNNFYSLFFVIIIILSIVLLVSGNINKMEYAVVNSVSSINIVVNVSRRAYVLYALILVLFVILVILKKKYFTKALIYNLLNVGIFGVLGWIFIFGFYSPNLPPNKKYQCYKIYSSFIDNAVTFEEFNIKQCGKYYLKHVSTDSNNLFFYGDLRNGLSAWEYYSSPQDCINFGLIENDVEGNTIRVERDCSSGNWQIHYKGRPLVYHKDVTYKISFAYKVIEGSANPFCVGWWVDEGRGYMCNLPQKITIIDSVWKHCMVQYCFREDHINPDCFLNSLQAGSAIEVKDIYLTCNDTTGLPVYADQLPDSVIHKYYSQDTINYFTAPRTDRWRYALELWQTRYNTKQKIFGQGFKYLEWYGEKFYGNPKRHDFPHNPIISSFLYSGIIGGVVYIIFLIMSLWLYWKRRKELGIFFIMYLCCMFFSMFSGSSHFSFPLFAFLSFLPFVEYKSEGKAEKVNVSQG